MVSPTSAKCIWTNSNANNGIYLILYRTWDENRQHIDLLQVKWALATLFFNVILFTLHAEKNDLLDQHVHLEGPRAISSHQVILKICHGRKGRTRVDLLSPAGFHKRSQHWRSIGWDSKPSVLEGNSSNYLRQRTTCLQKAKKLEIKIWSWHLMCRRKHNKVDANHDSYLGGAKTTPRLFHCYKFPEDYSKTVNIRLLIWGLSAKKFWSHPLGLKRKVSELHVNWCTAK